MPITQGSFLTTLVRTEISLFLLRFAIFVFYCEQAWKVWQINRDIVDLPILLGHWDDNLKHHVPRMQRRIADEAHLSLMICVVVKTS